MASAFLNDGHPTLIGFSGSPSSGILFKEKRITPPGIDGGGENDTTTFRNTLYRTRQPKKLLTLTECKATVSYNPELYDQVLDMVHENQLITLTFSDGSTYAFWGWLDKFMPGEIVEGAQPEAEITIIPSNQNNSGTEVEPVLTPAA